MILRSAKDSIIQNHTRLRSMAKTSICIIFFLLANINECNPHSYGCDAYESTSYEFCQSVYHIFWPQGIFVNLSNVQLVSIFLIIDVSLSHTVSCMMWLPVKSLEVKWSVCGQSQESSKHSITIYKIMQLPLRTITRHLNRSLVLKYSSLTSTFFISLIIH